MGLMNYKLILFTLILLMALILCKLLFRFKPRRSEKIYSKVIAHRGLHLFAPENSIAAYIAAKNANMTIELDIRQTKDDELVCFHDRYTKRLLNIPGKLSMFDLKTIKRYKILGSKENVPTLSEALDIIGNKVIVLIEIKDTLNETYIARLLQIVDDYNGECYFHTKSICNYFKLKKLFSKIHPNEKRVYYILDIFRKRFNYVKGKDYSSQVNKYNELASNIEFELPSVHDISSIIVKKIEELEDRKEILATIGEVINKYESRVNSEGKKHWVYNSLWLHRGIVSNRYLEHSKEGFEACVDFAINNDAMITVEFDVMLYKGEARCYHNDRISTLFGQSKSCAEKIKLENSMKLLDILKIFKGKKNINLALDIKDYHISNRELEDLIIKDIEASGYDGNFIVMSYNPMVLYYFKTVRPEWLRAQIGHSLKGLRKVPFFRFPWILNGILGILFDMSCADCIVLDDSKWIYYLILYHKNIRGKPILIYAPKTYMEQEAFIGKDSVANFIIENVTDENSWPQDYIEHFTTKERG